MTYKDFQLRRCPQNSAWINIVDPRSDDLLMATVRSKAAAKRWINLHITSSQWTPPSLTSRPVLVK